MTILAPYNLAFRFINISMARAALTDIFDATSAIHLDWCGIRIEEVRLTTFVANIF